MGGTSKDYQWLQLDRNLFNFSKNIFVCLAYIIPANSSYVQQCDEDILDQIERDMIGFKDKGHSFLCGD